MTSEINLHRKNRSIRLVKNSTMELQNIGYIAKYDFAVNAAFKAKDRDIEHGRKVHPGLSDI